MIRKWGPLLLILLAMPMMVFAQGTGKLSGRVIDESTGEGLPGANVILQGTSLGATTDLNGDYFILGVPVGSYTVQATFVGFAPETVQGVEINAGYTRELNFDLLPGVELDEVVVEYERPLLQKDAVGVPKIVTAEEIVNLPVRGAADLAKIQAGVVSKEGSNDLFIRGGRSGEVDFYIDGVKVTGTTTLNIPQSAIEQQEIQTGNINARYGDVMSGVINITTKSGSQQFFGSVEALTSEELDPYGYNLISGTVGGPIIKNKLNFFVAGEYTDQLDSSPRAVGELQINPDVLDNLRAFPTAFRATDASGNDIFLPIPASLADGATLPVDDNGLPILNGGMLTFSDGTTVDAQGFAADQINLNPVLRAGFVDPNDTSVEKAKLKREFQNLSLIGNMTWEVLDNTRLRVGGRVNIGEFDSGVSNRRIVFAPEMATFTERDEWQVYGTVTQRLSNTTFFQLQADFSDFFSETYDPRFGKSESDLLEYGNIDNPVFNTLAGYRDLGFTPETRVNDNGTPDDTSDDTEFVVNVPTFTRTYRDGAGPATSDDVVSTLVQIPGGRFNGYSKAHNQQFRLSGNATTQVGVHQIEFGGEFEKRIRRSWNVNAAALARYVADGNPEQIDPNNPNTNPDGYSNFGDIPLNILDTVVGNVGFDLLGRNEVDSEDFAGVVSQDINKPLSSYNIAPYEPIYYGGYVQDKIEFNDIVLNVGIRVDVFDNNTRVLKDRFSRRPVCRGGDVGTTVNGVDCGTGLSAPGNIGEDYSVFYSGDSIVGYRDTNGNFFDQNGQTANPGDILLNGNVRQTNGLITEDMFEDYDPEVTFMPRLGISFPVTDRAVFFASYGIVSQRPSTNSFVTLNGFTGTGGISNTNLRPEKTTKYELGFRQRLGDRAALTISGFYSQIENLIQVREVRGASPSVYTSFENVDFGTVKGLEFAFDLRRTNGFLANLNYTLQFADGTGSGSNTTGTIVWVDETPPNFISPLDFDQRHNLNLSLDYRLGQGEGPELFGVNILENFGFNILAKAGSGFPYTPVVEPFSLAGAARATRPRGGINGARMPWSNRIDLRVDRRFAVGSGNASVTAFLWVQNLFDNTNINNVWRFTGLADNDGFLATAAGSGFLADRPALSEDLYLHRNRIQTWVGIPRMTRIGLRLDF